MVTLSSPARVLVAGHSELPAPLPAGSPDDSDYGIDRVPEVHASLPALQLRDYHLVVLCGGGEAVDACRAIRRLPLAPAILLLASRGGGEERIAALRCGADDCLTPPYYPGEVAARVEALLRRARRAPASLPLSFPVGDAPDLERGCVWKNGQALGLTRKELHLLRYLIARRGAVVTRAELLREVWGFESARTRTVDMHVALLRRKLERDPRDPRHILTVRGAGYTFRARPEPPSPAATTPASSTSGPPAAPFAPDPPRPPKSGQGSKR